MNWSDIVEAIDAEQATKNHQFCKNEIRDHRMTADQQFTIEIVKWIVILVGIVSLSATLVGIFAFWNTKTGAAKTFSMLIQRGSIIRLAAIFAIIFSTFILCIAGILKPDLAASIFSGIAGYVLGGAPNARSIVEDSGKEDSD